MKHMERSILGIATLGLAIVAAGCDESLEEDVAKESAAVTISNEAGTLSIEAPPGEYTAFSLDASCSHDEGPDGGYSVWTRAAYSIATRVDCLDCFLPATVVVGELVDEHEITACLPSNAHVGCDEAADVSGLVLGDLLAPATLDNGEQAPVDSVGVMFFRVHEVWDDSLEDHYGTTIPFPRIDVASSRLSVSSGEVVSAGAEWTFCDDALNSDSCF
jgi:hypothetical protein